MESGKKVSKWACSPYRPRKGQGKRETMKVQVKLSIAVLFVLLVALAAPLTANAQGPEGFEVDEDHLDRICAWQAELPAVQSVVGWRVIALGDHAVDYREAYNPEKNHVEWLGLGYTFTSWLIEYDGEIYLLMPAIDLAGHSHVKEYPHFYSETFLSEWYGEAFESWEVTLTCG